MSSKVLLDTNVMLDLALARPEGFDAAAAIAEAVAYEEVVAYVCATSLKDLYYILSKAMGEEMAPYFAEMLSALPPAVDIFAGDGEGWVKSTPAQIAADTQVKDYAPRVFSDVAGTNYELAANTLCTYGMLRGYADGTFHPDNGLTRAELCAILYRTVMLAAGEAA